MKNGTIHVNRPIMYWVQNPRQREIKARISSSSYDPAQPRFNKNGWHAAMKFLGQGRKRGTSNKVDSVSYYRDSSREVDARTE